MGSEDNVTFTLENTTPPPTPRRALRPIPNKLREMIFEVITACLEKQRRTPPLDTDGVYCNRTIDGLGGCWPDTKSGTVARIPCPDLPVLNRHAFAYKECTINGTWLVNSKTGAQVANYSECRMRPDQFDDATKHIYIFIGGFSLSIFMLLLSLAIFFRFRQLRCDRITIHKNLFISYVLTGLSWVLYYALVALDGLVLLENPIWCQVLHVMCQYFTVCNFLWMFCEGLYLNTIMVYAFGTGKALILTCYLVGWGLSLILTTVYATIRGGDASNSKFEGWSKFIGVLSFARAFAADRHVKDSYSCWMDESNLQWIMYGPIVLSIVINVCFLINIMRLLITKLREMPEVAQKRKAARATLILVPLLGLQYLLFPIRPEQGSGLEDFYHITVALIVSLQGAFVSLIYCFCNGEVIALLRRKYRQHRMMKSRSLQRSSSGHGTTTYTIVDPMGDTGKRHSMSKESHIQQTAFSAETT